MTPKDGSMTREEIRWDSLDNMDIDDKRQSERFYPSSYVEELKRENERLRKEFTREDITEIQKIYPNFGYNSDYEEDNQKLIRLTKMIDKYRLGILR